VTLNRLRAVAIQIRVGDIDSQRFAASAATSTHAFEQVNLWLNRSGFPIGR
jgi:hypothetical protein